MPWLTLARKVLANTGAKFSRQPHIRSSDHVWQRSVKPSALLNRPMHARRRDRAPQLAQVAAPWPPGFDVETEPPCAVGSFGGCAGAVQDAGGGADVHVEGDADVGVPGHAGHVGGLQAPG